MEKKAEQVSAQLQLSESLQNGAAKDLLQNAELFKGVRANGNQAHAAQPSHVSA